MPDNCAAEEFSGAKAQAAFQEIEALCIDLVGLKLFTCSIFDMEYGVARRVYSNDPTAYPVSGLKEITPNRWTRHVIEKGQPFLAKTVEELRDVFPDHEKIEALGLGATINLPVVLPDGRLVTLNLLDRDGAYDEASVALLGQNIENFSIPSTH